MLAAYGQPGNKVGFKYELLDVVESTEVSMRWEQDLRHHSDRWVVLPVALPGVQLPLGKSGKWQDTLVSPQILLLLFSPVCSHELSLLSGGFTRSQVSKAVNILNMVLSCELGYVQLGYNVLSFNQLGNALRRQRQSKGTLRLNQVRVQECWHIPLVCPYNRLVDSAPVNMGGWLVSVLHCLFEHNIESLFLEHCMPIILSSLTSVSLENSLFIL